MAIQRTSETGIGDLIKKQREKMKITQTSLSELLFTERTTVSKWESGKNIPPIDKIADLCAILNIEPMSSFLRWSILDRYEGSGEKCRKNIMKTDRGL